MTIGVILSPDRAARMVAQHALDPTLPGLSDVIESLRKATFDAAAATPYEQEIRRATARVLTERLMELAASAPMPQVRALASRGLQSIQKGFASPGTASAATGDGAAAAMIAADIKRFLERPLAPVAMPALPDAPPGAPIGDPGFDWPAPVGWCTWISRL